MERVFLIESLELLHLDRFGLSIEHVLWRVEALLFEVGQAARLPHDEHYEEEADEVPDRVIVESTVDAEAAVDHEIKRQADHRQVDELRRGSKACTCVDTGFWNVEPGDGAHCRLESADEEEDEDEGRHVPAVLHRQCTNEQGRSHSKLAEDHYRFSAKALNVDD